MIQWNLYDNLIHLDGSNQRMRTINRSKRELNKLAPNSPAYKEVLVDGKQQNVMIISSSTELDTKKITSMSNETINIGSIVEWNNEHWIVYDNDCEDCIYQRGMMYRCNVYLKWQNEKGEIIGRYGYISDSSKQGVGLKSSGEIMYQLEQYYKGYFPLDSETIKIHRDKRFLMDIDSFEPDAYIVTNRKVMNYNFNSQNIDENYVLNTKDHLIIFMFTQTQRNESRDNFDIMIADYNPIINKEPSTTKPRLEIEYSGENTIKCGGSTKTFVGKLYDENGDSVENPSINWIVTILENEEKYIHYKIIENQLIINVDANEKLIGTQFKITLCDNDNTLKSELFIKVVSLYD